MKIFRILITLFLIQSFAFGQQKFLKKVEMGIHIGPSIPVGEFSKKLVESSLEENYPGSSPRRFRGFVKDHGGQAKPGLSVGINLTYNFHSSFFASLNYRNTLNRIDTNPQQQYYDENFRMVEDYEGNLFEVPGLLQSDPYKARIFYLGLGYQLQMKRINLSIAGLAGLNSLRFPFYSWTYPFSDTAYILLRPYPLVDPLPTKLKEFVYGFEVKSSYPISKRLNFNLSASYLRSDHPHDYWTNALAASYGYEIHDVIRYRNLMVELGVAYQLYGKGID